MSHISVNKSAGLELLRQKAREIELSLTPEEREAIENRPQPAPDELDVMLQEAVLSLPDIRLLEEEVYDWHWQQQGYDDEMALAAAAAPGGTGRRKVIEARTVHGRYQISLYPAEGGTEKWLLVVRDSVAKEGRVIVWDEELGRVLMRAPLIDGEACEELSQPVDDLARLKFRTERPITE